MTASNQEDGFALAMEKYVLPRALDLVGSRNQVNTGNASDARTLRGAQALIVIVMGVAGVGKSTVGRLLAQTLGCPFLDGDSLHSPANIDKMAHGIPLTNGDRAPWLAAIRAHLEDAFARGKSFVITCSALKQQYRDFLAARVPVAWVYPKGTEETIR